MIYQSDSLTVFQREISKSIYCFGAGRAFDSFVNEFADYALEKQIKAVADNDKGDFSASVKVVNGIAIPIISLNQMLEKIEEGDCILITTAAYREVMRQLEDIEKLKNTICYVYRAVRMEQYDYDRQHIKTPVTLSVYQERKIPKIIHYCWFGKKEIPKQYRIWMESWKRYCPDYEIIEWNEDNYDVNKSKYVSQAYEAKKWAFVSDYARIDIVNEYGGVYLDTDVELVKNIDQMLQNDAFCCFESCQYVAYGLGVGAKRNHPILQAIKEYYDSRDFVRKDGTLDQTSCPVIQTEVMKKYGLICDGSFQVIEGMTVYPPCVLCGMSPYSFRRERDSKYTYAVHHYEGSWIDSEQKQCMEDVISYIKKWSRNDHYIYTDF